MALLAAVPPALAVLAGCGLAGGSGKGEAAGSPATDLTSAPATTDQAGADPGSTAPEPADPARWCAGLTAAPAGTVEAAELTELSGLAASQVHPGVVWAHNDSGNDPILFALGPDGADLARFPLTGVVGTDIEDMALADGTVYLGDIGDNDRERSEIAVHRFPEPDPAAPGPVEGVETLRFAYPDGPDDAEAMLVDPLTGQLVIITKDFRFAPADADNLLTPAPATVYVADPPFASGGVIELVAAGTVALDDLATATTAVPAEGTAADLGLGGLATGADISADGRVVAIRTYATVWLFDRPEGSTVAQALAGTPCEAPSRPEPQGEAVAVLAGPGFGLVTASEGLNPELNRIAAP